MFGLNIFSSNLDDPSKELSGRTECRIAVIESQICQTRGQKVQGGGLSKMGDNQVHTIDDLRGSGKIVQNIVILRAADWLLGLIC